MDGFFWSRSYGPGVSRDSVGCDGREWDSAQTSLQNVQRLHDRAAQRIALGLLSARQLLQELRVGAAIESCEGGAMKMESIAERRKLRRKVQGIAAALLPFEADGRIAVEAFQKHLQATQRAGLMNAVNMDTGYVNYLGEAEKLEVLRWTREALGKDAPFVGGAYIEGQDGEVVALYRKQLDAIVAHGGIPILFQTSRLHGKSSAEKAGTYAAVCRGYSHVLAFELGPMFATNGEIFDEETVWRLIEIPDIRGMK